jgi:hypothetical protein
MMFSRRKHLLKKGKTNDEIKKNKLKKERCQPMLIHNTHDLSHLANITKFEKTTKLNFQLIKC